MALTKAQHRNLSREYDIRRTEAQRIRREHLEEIRSSIPEYSALEDEATDVAASFARRYILNPSLSLDEMDRELERINVRQEELLRENGFDPSYVEPAYTCPDCEDTGYIDGHKCHCLKEAEYAILYNTLYDKSHMHTLTETDNFDALREDLFTGPDLEHFREAVKICHDFVDNFDTAYDNLLFTGSVGTGKSFLSSCIARDLLEAKHSVIYFSASDFFDACADTAFGRNSEDELNDDNDLYECDLLIIDDLGTEYANQFVSSTLFACLNARHNKRKSTIISTNLSLSDIQSRYSDRIFSRLTGYYTILKLTGPDLRMKLRTAKN